MASFVLVFTLAIIGGVMADRGIEISGQVEFLAGIALTIIGIGSISLSAALMMNKLQDLQSALGDIDLDIMIFGGTLVLFGALLLYVNV